MVTSIPRGGLRLFATVLLLLGMGAGALQAATITLSDGSFEASPVGQGSFAKFKGGTEHWTPAGGERAVEIWSTGFFGVEAAHGDTFMELNANTRGTVYQEIGTIAAGQVLDFSFAHRGRNGPDEMAFVLDIRDANGDVIEKMFSEIYTAKKGAWTRVSGRSAAAGQSGTVRLSFVSQTPGSSANFVDNVHVETSAIPLPAGVVLLGTGLAALVVARRRRMA